MVVSTDRPFVTAVREAPAPMWAVTTRSSSGLRPNNSLARRLAQAWLSP